VAWFRLVVVSLVAADLLKRTGGQVLLAAIMSASAVLPHYCRLAFGQAVGPGGGLFFFLVLALKAVVVL